MTELQQRQPPSSTRATAQSPMHHCSISVCCGLAAVQHLAPAATRTTCWSHPNKGAQGTLCCCRALACASKLVGCFGPLPHLTQQHTVCTHVVHDALTCAVTALAYTRVPPTRTHGTTLSTGLGPPLCYYSTIQAHLLGTAPLAFGASCNKQHLQHMLVRTGARQTTMPTIAWRRSSTLAEGQQASRGARLMQPRSQCCRQLLWRPATTNQHSPLSPPPQVWQNKRSLRKLAFTTPNAAQLTDSRRRVSKLSCAAAHTDTQGMQGQAGRLKLHTGSSKGVLLTVCRRHDLPPPLSRLCYAIRAWS